MTSIYFLYTQSIEVFNHSSQFPTPFPCNWHASNVLYKTQLPSKGHEINLLSLQGNHYSRKSLSVEWHQGRANTLTVPSFFLTHKSHLWGGQVPRYSYKLLTTYRNMFMFLDSTWIICMHDNKCLRSRSEIPGSEPSVRMYHARHQWQLSKLRSISGTLLVCFFLPAVH